MKIVNRGQRLMTGVEWHFTRSEQEALLIVHLWLIDVQKQRLRRQIIEQVKEEKTLKAQLFNIIKHSREEYNALQGNLARIRETEGSVRSQLDNMCQER
eukprot:UN33343